MFAFIVAVVEVDLHSFDYRDLHSFELTLQRFKEFLTIDRRQTCLKIVLGL